MRQLRRSIRRSTSRRLRGLLAPTMGVGLFLASSTAFAQGQPPGPAQPQPPAPSQDDVQLPGVDVRGQGREYRAPSSDL